MLVDQSINQVPRSGQRILGLLGLNVAVILIVTGRPWILCLPEYRFPFHLYSLISNIPNGMFSNIFMVITWKSSSTQSPGRPSSPPPPGGAKTLIR